MQKVGLFSKLDIDMDVFCNRIVKLTALLFIAIETNITNVIMNNFLNLLPTQHHQ